MKPSSRSAAFLAALAAVSAPLAASALTPQAGTFSVAIHEDTWGRGSSVSCEDIAGGCGAARMSDYELSGEDANDEASSYEICNNMGETKTFRVQMFRDANYKDRFEHRYVTVDDNACVTRNIAINDEMSSFAIQLQ